MSYPFRRRLFCYFREPGFFWFRVLGYGLCVREAGKHRLSFSERQGLAYHLRIGKYIVTGLTP